MTPLRRRSHKRQLESNDEYNYVGVIFNKEEIDDTKIRLKVNKA